MIIEHFHFDRIVQNSLPVLSLPLLDGDEGIFQQLPLDVHLVAGLAGEDAGRGAVILNVIDLAHGALGVKVLANLLVH